MCSRSGSHRTLCFRLRTVMLRARFDRTQPPPLPDEFFERAGDVGTREEQERFFETWRELHNDWFHRLHPMYGSTAAAGLFSDVDAFLTVISRTSEDVPTTEVAQAFLECMVDASQEPPMAACVKTEIAHAVDLLPPTLQARLLDMIGALER
jgi:hypothetical protein